MAHTYKIELGVLSFTQQQSSWLEKERSYNSDL